MVFLLWLLVLIAVSATVSAIVTSTLLRGRGEALPGAVGGTADERLRRLEAAVESLTAEVERVSEGQRFLTEVLSERNGHPRLRPPDEHH